VLARRIGETEGTVQGNRITWKVAADETVWRRLPLP